MSLVGDIYDNISSYLGGLFGGGSDGPDYLAMGIAETGVTPPLAQTSFLVPDVPGLPNVDVPGVIPQAEDEDEDDPLKDEKQAAAEAARALQVQEQGRSGRSSTFLTRGMDLGVPPVRQKALLGQGW